VGRDLLLCIIRVMECGWGWQAVIKLSKIDWLWGRTVLLSLLLPQRAIQGH